MTETLYQYMPEGWQETVDQIAANMEPESWETRFFYLLGLLGEQLKTRADPDPALLLQQWRGLVTAFLEKLPPDSSVTECLALMSISYSPQWRAQVLAQVERDPMVIDRIDAAYPFWAEILASIEETSGP